MKTNSVPEASLAARQPPIACTCSVRSSEPPQSLLTLAVTVRLPVLTICWHTVMMSSEGTAPHNKTGKPLARSDAAIWLPTVPMKVLGAVALPELDGVVAEMVSWAQEPLPSCRRRRSIRKRRDLIPLLKRRLMAAVGWRVEAAVLARGLVQLVDVDDQREELCRCTNGQREYTQVILFI